MSKLLAILMIVVAMVGTSAAGTFTAATCNYSDVNTLINGPTHTAADGDIINIPSGTCTWTTGLTVPSNIGITIIGSGTPNTSAATIVASASCSNTAITANMSSGSMFSMSPTVGNSTSRISCMNLIPTVPNPGFGSPITIMGTCSGSGCPSVRLDNLNIPSSWAANGISDDTFAIVANMFGVADHNTVGDVPSASNGVDFINVSHGNWLGVGSWGDNSWATADTFGTAQAFYIENNTFTYAFGTDADAFGANFGGGRFVCRFNTFNQVTGASACANHGTDTIGRTRGGRQEELYGNTITCPAGGCDTAFYFRSAVGRIFGNSLSGFANTYASLDPQRRWRPDTPWGGCNGSSVWDTIDGTTYYSGTISSVGSGVGFNAYQITVTGSPGWTTNQWEQSGDPYSVIDVTQNFGYEIGASDSNSITTFNTGSMFGTNVPTSGDSIQIKRASICMDQPTRGAGLLVTGSDTSPTLVSTGSAGAVTEALDPTYEFADSGSPGHSEVASNTQGIIANRDFYAQTIGQAAQTSATSPFSGTSGTGYGTLARRPTTCTAGVGYFATDQGSWNTSGNSFGQGELFICGAGNSWTLSYTPYSYPHPLISGGGGGGTSAATMSGGTWTGVVWQ